MWAQYSYIHCAHLLMIVKLISLRKNSLGQGSPQAVHCAIASLLIRSG